MRQGLERACHSLGIPSKCVFTSEIKAHEIATYQENFQDSVSPNYSLHQGMVLQGATVFS